MGKKRLPPLRKLVEKKKSRKILPAATTDARPSVGAIEDADTVVKGHDEDHNGSENSDADSSEESDDEIKFDASLENEIEEFTFEFRDVDASHTEGITTLLKSLLPNLVFLRFLIFVVKLECLKHKKKIH
jgi:hypothetical protein